MLKTGFESARGKYHGFRRALVRLKVRSFQPKVQINECVGAYQIKTAETEAELLEVLRLRAEVFFEEKSFGNGKTFGLDFDKYDLLGDHLILKDLKSGQCIGTYRVLSNLFSEEFYSESEFEMEEFSKSPDTKLELGRACIAKEFRNGVSLNLIWKGIGAYAQSIGAKYIFGCTSISSLNRMIAESMTVHFFNEAIVTNEFVIKPRKKNQFKMKDYHPISVDMDVTKLIPALMNSYIKAGAKVIANPALDRKFGCFDFLTILDISKMDEKYKRRYFPGAIHA
ncbi:MAG: GNAT family N-acyltransferase [Bdellovibrionota bacterium]|nr:GNAT family N-acyltransferase [Bdellovibrionota bacterium]